jgi:plasmid stabilization system protein ParE
MKVVYTEEALRDLDAIADWLIVRYPAVARRAAHPECRGAHCAMAGEFTPRRRAFAWWRIKLR